MIGPAFVDEKVLFGVESVLGVVLTKCIRIVVAKTSYLTETVTHFDITQKSSARHSRCSGRVVPGGLLVKRPLFSIHCQSTIRLFLIQNRCF